MLSAKGGALALENIYYDFNKSNIRSDAAAILDRLIAQLRQHPAATVLLVAHTDARGNDAYNLRLSEQRVRSAKRYLTDRGVAASRVVTGFRGKRELSNQCGDGVPCPEEQHQLNKRIT